MKFNAGVPIAFIFFAWTTICYIVGMSAPWAYLSVKNAYGGHLGVNSEGEQYIPEDIQNKTCARREIEVRIWNGVCDYNTEGICTAFDDKDAWQALDDLNEEYAQYYKHAITTNFVGDDEKWAAVQSLSTICLVLFCVSVIAYSYGSCVDPEFQRKTQALQAAALMVASVMSFAAVAVSLHTYALGHQFYTGGGYYVESWFVWSEFVRGCDGPQYLPGPGIVMQPFGAITAFIPAFIILFGCCVPPPQQEQDGVSVVNVIAEATATIPGETYASDYESNTPKMAEVVNAPVSESPAASAPPLKAAGAPVHNTLSNAV